MPTQPQRSSQPSKKGLAAVVGTAVAALVIGLTSTQEGVALVPYKDKLANNIQTVCFGETKVAMHAYSMPECKDMLSDSLTGYAQGVKDSTPGFDGLTDGQKVGAIDLAYNVGLANYKASTLRRRYIARDFPGACAEFLKWRFVAGKDCAIAANRCGGIYTRRKLEMAACLGTQ